MNALKGYFEVIKLSIIRNDGTFALSVSLEIVQEAECEFELNALPKGGDFTVLWHKACLSCSPSTLLLRRSPSCSLALQGIGKT